MAGYNRTDRYDWRAHKLLETISKVEDFAAHRLWTFNREQPNMALSGITPKQNLTMVARPLML